MAGDRAVRKGALRDHVWTVLERAGVSKDAHGRIPDFTGAEAAAERLASLSVWQAARVVKANPDQPQLPVRARALREGKLVYMAVPKLADPRPFFKLDPAGLEVPPEEVALHRNAAKLAPKVAVEDMQPVDLIVCGSVAVNRDGRRLGKGAGYSDIEVALLSEAGLVGSQTTIVTTVHSLQVIDEPPPTSEHDFTVDFIVTPEQVISCGPAYRPPGLLRESLSSEQIAAIPALGALK